MKIIELSKNEYKGYELDYKYVTKFYYDVVIKKKKAIVITLKRKKFRKKVEKKFTDHLFEDYIEAPEVYGIFDKKKLIAVIECGLDTWNKRYRIYNFLVDPRYRKMGYGTALFKHAEEVAKKKNARGIILETQSCNDPAISFYMKQGLHFVGLDTMCYSDNDIEKKEVRIEFGKRI